MAATPTSEGRRSRLAHQRKRLPDGPGVYLFRDERGKVIYVGKAKSIKKRVASHFSNPVTRGAFEMVEGASEPKTIIIIEFPSMLRAKEWYASPEYAAALKVRNQGALNRRLIFVEGV